MPPGSLDGCIVQHGDILTLDTEHPCYPHARPGLGDMVAAGLAAVGITKERVSAVLGRDCGCPKRQQALNEFGKRLGIGGNADAGPSLQAQR